MSAMRPKELLDRLDTIVKAAEDVGGYVWLVKQYIRVHSKLSVPENAVSSNNYDMLKNHFPGN